MADLSILERLQEGIAPRELRMAIAEGLIPLDSDELVEAINILSQDPDKDVQSMLIDNIPELPRPLLLQITADKSTKESFLAFLVHIFIEDEEILTNVILNKSTSNETLVEIAGLKLPSVLSLLSENKRRMFACSELMETLLENDELPRVNKFALKEFKDNWVKSFPAREKQAINKEDIPDKTESSTATISKPIDIPFEDFGDEPSTATIDKQLKQEKFDDIDIEKPEIAESVKQSSTDTKTVSDLKGLKNGWEISDLVEEVGTEVEKERIEDSEWDIVNIEDEEEVATAETEKTYADWEEFDVKVDFDEESSEEEDDEKLEDIRFKLRKLPASEKLLLAKMGTKQERAILLRDSNKKVALAVVQSPKLTEFEVKLIASNRSVNEDVLREIYRNREWGNKPIIRKELTLNPKTPLEISLKLLNTLNDFDLKEVAKSKEIAYGLSASAKRLHQLREQRKR